MKILITGADGFIGSHLTEMLLRKNYNVKALSFYNSFNNWGWLEGLRHQNLEIVTGDIRDPHFCNMLLKDIEVVFHLAALIAIPYSYIAPNSYLETNISGTLNICQAARDNNVKRVLVTSTSEVYGTAKYVPIDENHPKQPQSPYSASKIGADAIALSFFNSFQLPVTIVRPFNTYGPRQSARAFIPTVITQIASGKKNIKLGDLTPTRDFTFVQDTCEGFIQLAECNESIGQEINISSNFEISMSEITELIAKKMNSEIQITKDNNRIRPKNSEVFRLFGDNSKIQKLTGFKPKYNIEKGLSETIKWFLNEKNLANYKWNIYNV
ncbi:MAG: NAD-dependent dehydratase [Bacteroidetes bacterium RIFOXYA12_FULL_35_11]|nr:MAG: NAD-dependent dehydratase [Bacteroidetes bacterium GWF2_35_48]OFY81654.1 MAG: NAD-dependent dehydratase [Bacteroidetes bacterium RIFOXYA12_FULL_35_11]OFY95465.1 MAG: NAD-dependent dehydratase [Bacteroidetes bacterium RIFOXYC12_FULL_35_7]HBX52987.1 NAD-dependent dehydratase [Bacteroidales bacterium]